MGLKEQSTMFQNVYKECPAPSVFNEMLKDKNSKEILYVDIAEA